MNFISSLLRDEHLAAKILIVVSILAIIVAAALQIWHSKYVDLDRQVTEARMESYRIREREAIRAEGFIFNTDQNGCLEFSIPPEIKKDATGHYSDAPAIWMAWQNFQKQVGAKPLTFPQEIMWQISPEAGSTIGTWLKLETEYAHSPYPQAIPYNLRCIEDQINSLQTGPKLNLSGSGQ